MALAFPATLHTEWPHLAAKCKALVGQISCVVPWPWPVPLQDVVVIPKVFTHIRKERAERFSLIHDEQVNMDDKFLNIDKAYSCRPDIFRNSSSMFTCSSCISCNENLSALSFLTHRADGAEKGCVGKVCP
ncbi:hypothetical protein Pelo_16339 [Pelomyxa schiedti]|nr:hypothetical protein Pelo_16339 [Pelomyxa schiedti]